MKIIQWIPGDAQEIWPPLNTNIGTVYHIGVQIPYRPFITYRKGEKDEYTGKDIPPCFPDVTIAGKDYIVNAPGILEFDNLSMENPTITLSFQDGVSNSWFKPGLVLVEIAVDG